MNAHLAEENLQTIRLLMERSALYRRALAPIMLLAGILGMCAAAIGMCFHVESSRPFAALWLGTACVVVTSAFVLVRRQALRDHEPFWSPPTFRVAQALLPPLLSGLFLGAVLALLGDALLAGVSWAVDFPMALVWLFFYGCALHSAGFFMMRGIKWFGWVFIGGAILLVICVHAGGYSVVAPAGNWTMGIFFGALQLSYGTYLYYTESKTNAA
jgi:hypothetical protein